MPRPATPGPQQADAHGRDAVEDPARLVPLHVTAAHCPVEDPQALRAEAGWGDKLVFPGDHPVVAGQFDGGQRIDGVAGHGSIIGCIPVAVHYGW